MNLILIWFWFFKNDFDFDENQNQNKKSFSCRGPMHKRKPNQCGAWKRVVGRRLSWGKVFLRSSWRDLFIGTIWVRFEFVLFLKMGWGHIGSATWEGIEKWFWFQNHLIWFWSTKKSWLWFWFDFGPENKKWFWFWFDFGPQN